MDEVCPKCGEAAVTFDVVAGLSACEACGTVLAEEQLVHHTEWGGEGGGPLGAMFVGAADTGERAGAYALQARGAGLAIQRSRHKEGETKLKQRVREFSALLHLQPAIVDQALHLLEQAIPHAMGNWRRDLLAAAATYAACRLNSLPLTMADLSASTQIELHVLGRHYWSLCRLLDLQPPLLQALDLLPRSIDRVTSEAVQAGALGAPVVAALRRDTAMLLDWLQQQLTQRMHPMANVGAAIVLAAELNTVSLSLDHVCASLPLSRFTLDRKLAQARRRLLQLAALLPYSATINTRNVGSHARTIIKLAALVGSATSAGGGSCDGGRKGAGMQQQQQHGMPQEAQQQQQQLLPPPSLPAQAQQATPHQGHLQSQAQQMQPQQQAQPLPAAAEQQPRQQQQRPRAPAEQRKRAVPAAGGGSGGHVGSGSAACVQAAVPSDEAEPRCKRQHCEDPGSSALRLAGTAVGPGRGARRRKQAAPKPG